MDKLKNKIHSEMFLLHANKISLEQLFSEIEEDEKCSNIIFTYGSNITINSRAKVEENYLALYSSYEKIDDLGKYGISELYFDIVAFRTRVRKLTNELIVLYNKYKVQALSSMKNYELAIEYFVATEKDMQELSDNISSLYEKADNNLEEIKYVDELTKMHDNLKHVLNTIQSAKEQGNVWLVGTFVNQGRQLQEEWGSLKKNLYQHVNEALTVLLSSQQKDGILICKEIAYTLGFDEISILHTEEENEMISAVRYALHIFNEESSFDLYDEEAEYFSNINFQMFFDSYDKIQEARQRIDNIFARL